MIVKYPELRADVYSAIEFLANTEAERIHVRFNENGEMEEFMDLRTCVGILEPFFTTNPSNQSSFEIGVIFASLEEAQRVERVTSALYETILIDYPDELSAEYVKTPRWNRVVYEAQNAMIYAGI